jgi:hypothetical protein
MLCAGASSTSPSYRACLHKQNQIQHSDIRVVRSVACCFAHRVGQSRIARVGKFGRVSSGYPRTIGVSAVSASPQKRSRGIEELRPARVSFTVNDEGLHSDASYSRLYLLMRDASCSRLLYHKFPTYLL